MAEVPPDLFAAIDRGELDEVRSILARYPAVASRRSPMGVSPILYARYRGRHDIIEALEASGADLDIFDACALGRVPLLNLLLVIEPSLATSWSADGYTPISLAAFFAQPDAVRRLLDAGGGAVADMPSRNNMRVTALHAAVAGRSLEAVELVLTAGVDVNREQEGGYTALAAARQNGDLEIEAMLIAHGAE